MDEILINNGFKFIASIIMAMGLFILNNFKNEMKETKTMMTTTLGELKESVASLNIHIATLIEKDIAKNEKLLHHEKTLQAIDKRITYIKDHHNDNLTDLKTEIALMKQKIQDIETDLSA